MNLWGTGAVIFFAAIAYFVGWQHGNDVGVLATTPGPVFMVQTDPYSATCGQILQLAWDIQPDKAVMVGPNK